MVLYTDYPSEARLQHVGCARCSSHALESQPSVRARWIKTPAQLLRPKEESWFQRGEMTALPKSSERNVGRGGGESSVHLYYSQALADTIITNYSQRTQAMQVDHHCPSSTALLRCCTRIFPSTGKTRGKRAVRNKRFTLP